VLAATLHWLEALGVMDIEVLKEAAKNHNWGGDFEKIFIRSLENNFSAN